MAAQFVSLPGEIWKPVIGFPKYEVSSKGRIRSLPWTFIRHEWRHGREQVVHVGGNLIGGWIKYRKGLPMARMVTLRRDGRGNEFRLHRLVLEAFVGPCPDGMEGCHNDGNPLNNDLDNLRWDTHVANMEDARRHGTASKPPTHWGEKHHNATLTDAQIATIRGTPIVRGTKARLAREYGVSGQAILRFLRGDVRNGGPGST